MRTALIGHTGFVGSNLLAEHPFDELYRSTNIETIAGERFDLVVCAARRPSNGRRIRIRPPTAPASVA